MKKNKNNCSMNVSQTYQKLTSPPIWSKIHDNGLMRVIISTLIREKGQMLPMLDYYFSLDNQRFGDYNLTCVMSYPDANYHIRSLPKLGLCLLYSAHEDDLFYFEQLSAEKKDIKKLYRINAVNFIRLPVFSSSLSSSSITDLANGAVIPEYRDIYYTALGVKESQRRNLKKISEYLLFLRHIDATKKTLETIFKT